MNIERVSKATRVDATLLLQTAAGNPLDDAHSGRKSSETPADLKQIKNKLMKIIPCYVVK